MMEAVRPASRSASHGSSLNGNYTTRPRAASDRDPILSGTTSRASEENRPPSTLPKAFRGMLKTTTETGDIGMFSIKPSRIPQSLNSPRRTGEAYNENTQKPRQSFQLYGAPGVDDRRRLPSYARDATSEVISMYETASQKSGNRGYEDPDYRSYSMTQTSSYSSYTLSNHRSYASLRSQQDGNGLLQRPRSPFAYPTRLKRPGFRPSSPALTDGGAVDYSRRAEIERVPHGPSHSTSSPSSLYAQKRRPPLSLRNEANRSTPSLLSQNSPPQRSSSPNIRQSTGNQGIDWARRNAPTSVNTSPARSTFSLASTANAYAIAAPVSTSTTPGKFHPPSPLYYDYTEDFDIDDYDQPEPLAPPPAFRIDKSIPEDHPIGAERPSTTITDARSRDASLGTDLRSLSSTASNLQNPFEEPLICSKRTQDTSTPTACPPNVVMAVTGAQLDAKLVDSKGDTKVIRLSGLGYGAQELSTHVEEVFGLPSSPSFEITISDSIENGGTGGEATDMGSLKQKLKEIETQSARSSGYSLNTNLQQFPLPPDFQKLSNTKEFIGIGQLPDPVRATLRLRVSEDLSQLFHSSQNLPKQKTIDGIKSNDVSYSTQRSSQRRRPSGFSSADTESTELAECITSLNRSQSPNDRVPEIVLTHTTPMTSPTLPDEFLLRKAYSGHSINPRQPPVNQISIKVGHMHASAQPQNRNQQHHRGGRIEQVPPLAEFSTADMPNFSHQIPRKLMSRPESPMLAPKPISPARQLRLKNSVPQLMKALSPLPPDPPIRAVSPPDHLASLETELPCRFSPLLPERKPTLNRKPQEAGQSALVQKASQKALPKKPEDWTKPDSEPMETIIDGATRSQVDAAGPLHFPRLKLKGRNASTTRPLSPPDSRPWNLEESYPWSGQNLNVGLPSLVPVDQHGSSKPPKFKLRVTRASNSTQGTICINRDSAESKPLAGLQLRNPKDLFTPTIGLDHIFRQVSRHLHQRRLSVNSINQSTESSPPPISHLISENANKSGDVITPETRSRSGIRSSSSEAQSSFSDDSSHICGRHRLRKRISNLRARMAVPYTSRVAAQSYDDINWEDRCDAAVPTPSALRSVPNLHSTRTITDDRPLRSLADRIHGQKLRAKVRGWLKEARSAIVARVKSRSYTWRESDDERTQITMVV